MIIDENTDTVIRDLHALSESNDIQHEKLICIYNMDALNDQHLTDSNFHQFTLVITEKLLLQNQFDLLYLITSYFSSLQSKIISDPTSEFASIYRKTVYSIGSQFFKSVQRKDVTFPFEVLILIYENFIKIFGAFGDESRLLYISNSLLVFGQKCKQADIDLWTEYWRKCVIVDLELHEQSKHEKRDLESLFSKIERLIVGFTETKYFSETMHLVGRTLSLYADKNGLAEKASMYFGDQILSDTGIKRIIVQTGRMCAEMASNGITRINFGDNIEVDLFVGLIEVLITTVSKSSSARISNKTQTIHMLVENGLRRFKSLELHPIRSLKLTQMHFRYTGRQFESRDSDMVIDTPKLLELVIGNKIENDELFSYASSAIISSTALSIVVSNDISLTEQLRYLDTSVSNAIEAMSSSSNRSEEGFFKDIELLYGFLELLGAHEKRTELLKGLLVASNDETEDWKLRLELIKSLLELGYTGAALREIETISSKKYDLKPVEHVWMKLREVDCYLAISKQKEASESFKTVCQLIADDELLKMSLLAGRSATEDAQHFQDRATLYAEICLALARLHIEEANAEYGINHAQKGTKFLHAFLKKFQASNGGTGIFLSYTWRMTSLLISSQVLTSVAYERIGILREACYYIGEASKVAKASACRLRLASILTFESELYVRSNNIEQATIQLRECEALIKDLNLKDINVLQYAHSAVLSLQRQRKFSKEQEYYALSDDVFKDLKEKSANFSVRSIANDISRLSLVEYEPEHGVNSSCINYRRPTGRKLRILTPSPSGDEHASTSDDIYAIEHVWNSIVRCQVYSLGLQNQLESAIELLDSQYEHSSQVLCERDNVLLDLARARNFYLWAKRELHRDGVLSMISESAISVPSVKGSTFSSNTDMAEEILKKLKTAKELIMSNVSRIPRVCTAVEVQNAASLLTTITVLISAVGNNNEVSGPLVEPCLVLQEMARSVRILGERGVTQVKSIMDGHFGWPVESDLAAQMIGICKNTEDLDTTRRNFEKKYLDTIPEKWAVVSINICSETDNLLVSRYEKHKQPTILSLPLNRHNARDSDETSFSFEVGMGKLKDIIMKSNETASVKRTSAIKSKEDRHDWWKERYGLDERLKDLLKDSEYCWVGGFLGIFDTNQVSQSIREWMAKQINRVLNTYLPSRNWGIGSKNRPRSKRSDTRQASEIEIDVQLVDLFVGLGPPDKISDPGLLEDLVYFIFDILQFHGEKNAYDEIEVDQMIVEIEEVLRKLHEKLASGGNNGNNQLEHIVLILDKKCQSFPWESIPCLRQKSITRIPSFTVFSHLLQQNLSLKHTIQKSHYILNPGQDLPRTESRFKPLFAKTIWNGINGIPPSESQFLDLLRTGDLFIYIGHGSGQQYIRSTPIKALYPHCPPVLLLGCSSGVLEGEGEYEPWGPPMNYLVAGSPMVVGNMWDVTDRDIDLFGIGVLERCGIIPAQNPGFKKRIRMGESVMKGRDECTLKYLNGAAPVVFGLPLELVLNDKSP